MMKLDHVNPMELPVRFRHRTEALSCKGRRVKGLNIWEAVHEGHVYAHHEDLASLRTLFPNGKTDQEMTEDVRRMVIV